MDNVDPVTLEVLNNAFTSVAEEMGASLIYSSYSPIIREMLDCSCAVFDREGRLLAQAAHIPAQLGLMEMGLRHTLQAIPSERLEEGDLLLMNHPYRGGSHTPDLETYLPVFCDGEIIAYAGTVAHHIDVGGRLPCTEGVDNTEIYQEGLLISPIKLYERGQPNEAVFTLLRDNVRNPVATLGDLRAQVAACRKAQERFAELADRYGPEQLALYADRLMAYAEDQVRSELASWPDGVYEAEGFMDDDGVDRGVPLRLHARLEVRGDSIEVDLSGCNPQVRGAVNLPFASTHAAVYFAVRCFTGAAIPQNSGATRPISIVAPAGTIVNPRPPAAVSVRHITCQRLTDVIVAALGNALPDRAIAGTHVSFPTHSFGTYDESKGYTVMITDIMGGGYGAMPELDGMDAVDTFTSNCGVLPAEVAEMEYPWRLVRSELVPDSGGPGRQRGGLALRRDYLLLAEEAQGGWYAEQTNPAFVPQGRAGGKPGTPAAVGIGRDMERAMEPAPSKFTGYLRQGDRLVLIASGGGGYGDALERDPAAVEEDVRNGRVSPEAAAREYGVAIDPATGIVDVAATARLRAERRQDVDS